MSQKKNNLLFQIYLIPAFVLMSAMVFLPACKEPADHSLHDRMPPAGHAMDTAPGKKVDLSTVSLPSNHSVISSQKTTRPVWSEDTGVVYASGYIALDERRDRNVSARFSGRIEILFVRYNFQYVKKGERVMEIYSAELNTIQEEYLFLLKNKSDSALAKKAEEKLKLMGIADSQIAELKKSGQVAGSVTVTSPYEGYVYFNNDKAPSGMVKISSGQMPDMESPTNSNMPLAAPINNSELQVREGRYVSKGQILFKLNDLKEVLAMLLVDNNGASGVSEGDEVELASELEKGNIIRAKVNLLEPVLKDGQKFLSARVYLKNGSGFLKINSLLTAKINSAKTKQLLIPSSSILFLGARKIVWVRTGEVEKGKYIFQVRDIATSAFQGDMTKVTSGLTNKDEIALEAGYMIDRESLIKSK